MSITTLLHYKHVVLINPEPTQTNPKLNRLDQTNSTNPDQDPIKPKHNLCNHEGIVIDVDSLIVPSIQLSIPNADKTEIFAENEFYYAL